MTQARIYTTIWYAYELAWMVKILATLPAGPTPIAVGLIVAGLIVLIVWHKLFVRMLAGHPPPPPGLRWWIFSATVWVCGVAWIVFS